MPRSITEMISEEPEKAGTRSISKMLGLSVPATPQAGMPEGQILPSEGSAQAYDPTAPTKPGVSGPTEAAMIAAGETTLKGLRNIQTMGLDNELRRQINELDPVGADTSQVRQDHPYATAAGDILPFASLPGSGLLTAPLSGAAAGLVFGGTGEQALVGALGGSAGAFFTRVLMTGVSPFAASRPLSGSARKAAKRLGVFKELDTAERTGNMLLQNMKKGVRVSSVQGEKAAANFTRIEKMINARLIKDIGQTGDKITPELIEAARIKEGAVFEKAVKAVGKIDKQSIKSVNQKLTKILSKAESELDASSFSRLQNQVKLVRDTLARNPTGQSVWAQRQAINELANSLRQGGGADVQLSRALQKAGDQSEAVSNVLDDLIMAKAPPRMKARLKVAKQRWSSLSNLREPNVLVDDSVNPDALRSVIVRKEQDAFARGLKLKNNPQHQVAKMVEGVNISDPTKGEGNIHGINALRFVNDATVGQIPARLLYPKSELAKQVIGNQIFAPRTLNMPRLGSLDFAPKDIGGLFGRAAGAEYPVSAESLFPSLRQ